ncbi:hypothetical protein QTI38_02000 [Clostridium perfringens]|uniref:hypothetical protein n=1 Tax=Clostridium perfringens TaxID=1502 RepID=UPI0039EBD570|nr:hypothetical protein [Clostridium perfringens]MDM0837200.1 hypothetical protein [Clostridium perfringens]
MNSIIKEFVFNVGWKKTSKITLFGNDFQITIKLQAYFEEDGITNEQEISYAKYNEDKENINKKIEDMLLNFDENAKYRFIPSTLIFERNGSYALLCDDKINLDGGIAVCIEPTKKIIYQDDYL